MEIHPTQLVFDSSTQVWWHPRPGGGWLVYMGVYPHSEVGLVVKSGEGENCVICDNTIPSVHCTAVEIGDSDGHVRFALPSAGTKGYTAILQCGDAPSKDPIVLMVGTRAWHRQSIHDYRRLIDLAVIANARIHGSNVTMDDFRAVIRDEI